MKSTYLIILFSIVLNIQGCWEREFYCFWVENNSDYDIVLHYNFIDAKHIYPDTLFSIEVSADKRLIRAHSTHKHNYFAERLEDYVHKMPKDTLSFFFFHADTLEKYPLEILQRDYKILRRYDLSSQDVIKLKRKYKNVPEIPYPPDERMKDMKMWPPYGSE